MPIAVALFFYLYLFIVGICIGSFVNVVIYRVPNGLSIAKGRSFCPACSHKLAAKDLVPVFSRMFLGGKCRYCGAPIAFRYTLVELIGGVCAAGSVLWFGPTLDALVAFAALMILTAVAFVDIDTLEIPNGFIIALAVPALAAVFVFGGVTPIERVIGFFVVSVPMWLLSLAIKDCFGGGDIKLMAVAGFLLGWKSALLALFLALLTGGAYGVYLLAAKKADGKSRFAFGPFLSVGTAASLFFGELIINWYIGLLM